MAQTFRDRVWHAVSGAPGTGAVTLAGAQSGYQTASAAGVANGETNVWTFLDGAAWEISSCVYTASGTSLARTLIASSTGSLLSLSAQATCFIDANASVLQSLLPATTAATASSTPYTAATPTAQRSYLDINNTSGAALEVDLPTTGLTTGQVMVVTDVGGNASTYTITIKASGTTIDTIAFNNGWAVVRWNGTTWVRSA